MRALLSALLLTCLAATAESQPALSVSANPYDGAGEAPLVIRNVGLAQISIDSIAFRAGPAAPSYRGVFITAELFSMGQVRTVGLDCGRYRTCAPTDLAEMLAPNDSLSLVIGEYCALCRSPGRVGAIATDTLLLYHAGLAAPLRVRITGYRQAVAGEPSPDASGLALSVSPNPSTGRGTVRLNLAVPAASATASVFDALGRRVADLHDGPLGAGPHDFAFDTAALAPGVYLVRVVTDGSAASRVVTVVR